VESRVRDNQIDRAQEFKKDFRYRRINVTAAIHRATKIVGARCRAAEAGHAPCKEHTGEAQASGATGNKIQLNEIPCGGVYIPWNTVKEMKK
jgi:hypothetical protein